MASPHFANLTKSVYQIGDISAHFAVWMAILCLVIGIAAYMWHIMKFSYIWLRYGRNTVMVEFKKIDRVELKKFSTTWVIATLILTLFAFLGIALTQSLQHQHSFIYLMLQPVTWVYIVFGIFALLILPFSYVVINGTYVFSVQKFGEQTITVWSTIAAIFMLAFIIDEI